MRPQHPQAPLTEEQRSIASSIELARQQNAKNLDKAVLMIEVRKWCVEKAIQGLWKEDSALSLVDLAGQILAFVSAPIRE